MTKLTGASLDQAVANVLGIKSVHNCEKWVGLTDEEVEKLDCVQVIWQDEGEVEICGVKEFYRNIEAKLKERNT